MIRSARWGSYRFRQRILADLDRILSAPEIGEPDADGYYRWTIGGREWRTRPYVGPGPLALHGLQTPILPAFYRCTLGHSHANVPELLRLVDLEDTPGNEQAVMTLLREAGSHAGIRMRISGQDA